MTQIKLKRVYEDYNENDDFRVLVDRLWPRGMKKEHLHYDLWEKDVTPSPDLRKWFHEDIQGRWDDFVKFYKKELSESNAVTKFAEILKSHKTVTLLYASREPEHNHAKILKAYLDEILKNK